MAPGDHSRRVVADHGLPAARRAGEDRPIQRHERLERDVGGFVVAHVDDPHAHALFASSGRPSELTLRSQPALRRSVRIVSCRVGYVHDRRTSSTPSSTAGQAACVAVSGTRADGGRAARRGAVPSTSCTTRHARGRGGHDRAAVLRADRGQQRAGGLLGPAGMPVESPAEYPMLSESSIRTTWLVRPARAQPGLEPRRVQQRPGEIEEQAARCSAIRSSKSSNCSNWIRRRLRWIVSRR